jgi:hypothetical protein
MTVKSAMGNENWSMIERNRILYNWEISRRIEEEKSECKCRKMTEDEIKKYCGGKNKPCN